MILTKDFLNSVDANKDPFEMEWDDISATTEKIKQGEKLADTDMITVYHSPEDGIQAISKRTGNVYSLQATHCFRGNCHSDINIIMHEPEDLEPVFINYFYGDENLLSDEEIVNWFEECISNYEH